METSASACSNVTPCNSIGGLQRIPARPTGGGQNDEVQNDRGKESGHGDRSVTHHPVSFRRNSVNLVESANWQIAKAVGCRGGSGRRSSSGSEGRGSSGGRGELFGQAWCRAVVRLDEGCSSAGRARPRRRSRGQTRRRPYRAESPSARRQCPWTVRQEATARTRDARPTQAPRRQALERVPRRSRRAGRGPRDADCATAPSSGRPGR